MRAPLDDDDDDVIMTQEEIGQSCLPYLRLFIAKAKCIGCTIQPVLILCHLMTLLTVELCKSLSIKLCSTVSLRVHLTCCLDHPFRVPDMQIWL